MKRFISMLLVACVMCFNLGSAIAGSVDVREEATDWVVVIDSQNVYSVTSSSAYAINIEKYTKFSYFVDIGGASPDIKLEQLVSTDTRKAELYSNKLSTTTTTGLNWVVPKSSGLIHSTITIDRADSFTPVTTKWLHIKATGNAGNGADTYVTVYIGVYSEK